MDQLPVQAVFLRVYRLRPRRPVDVGCGGYQGRLARPDLEGEEHEGGRMTAFEIGRALPREDRRGEGAELLPAFHLDVDQILHLRPAGIGEQAAVSQSPRSPFHPSLKPEDQPTRGKDAGNLLAERLFGKNLIGKSARSGRFQRLAIGEARAEIGVAYLALPGTPARLMVEVQGRPQCGSRVPGSGLN